jgi:tRNA(Arg) A34 adenosine deaminase TadA
LAIDFDGAFVQNSPLSWIARDSSKPGREVVAEGLNDAKACPVRHGEIDAIERCAVSLPDVDWSELWLYTTAEP